MEESAGYATAAGTVKAARPPPWASSPAVGASRAICTGWASVVTPWST